MASIKKDHIGLYCWIGGWKARPISPTKLKEGSKVNKVKHFGGSTIAGLGKDDRCKRGQYLEYWITSGTIFSETPTEKEELEKWEWYKANASGGVAAMNKRNKEMLGKARK